MNELKSRWSQRRVILGWFVVALLAIFIVLFIAKRLSGVPDLVNGQSFHFLASQIHYEKYHVGM